MRHFFPRAAFMALAALLSSHPAWAETVDVSFLLVNDIDRMEGSKERGGFARLAGVVKGERAKGGNVVFVHAGDTISPSLLSGFDQGAHVITLLNMMPPDIFVPGNHEFDFGPEVFLQRMAEARFLRLGANLRGADGAPIPGFEDVKMLQFDGAKIGVVGIAAEHATITSSPGNLKLGPSLATGVEQAKALRAAGADMVVAVAHAGRALDRELFDSRAFDLILSGDDHDLMVFFDGRTAMMEAKEQGEFVGIVDVTLDIEEKDGKREVEWWPNFRLIDTADATPDPDVQAKVEEFERELSKELDVAVGRTATPLDSRRAAVRTGEAAMGNLIADAMRAAVGADVALTNGGGIRGNKQYGAGTELTRRDILTELPFGNKTVKLEMTGAQIREALEHGLSDVANAAGRFPHVSGMVVTADLSAPTGSRVQEVMVGGAPLDAARTYTLATNDFMAGGGDGYAVLKEAKPLLGERDAKLLANDVMVFVREAGEVAPKVEGRIKTGG